jgi:hypothetical protein
MQPYFQWVEKAPVMAFPVPTMSQAVRNFWSAASRYKHSAPKPRAVLHDPAAQRAHDLDDPYFDEKVQMRIAKIIACAGHK